MGKKDYEERKLKYRAEVRNHIGFCFAIYQSFTCGDCPCEDECLKLFIEEESKNEKM